MHLASLPPRRPRTDRRAVCLAILAAALMTQGAMAASPDPGQTDARVAVEDFAFTPASVTIDAGASVVWAVRKDPEQHTVTPVRPDTFTASEELFAGDDYTIRFDVPGRYDYVCSLHPFMTGTVIVEAAAVASQTAPPTGSASAGALPSDSVPSGIASPSVEPTVAEAGDPSSVVILVLILILGFGIAAAVLRRRSTRHSGESSPTD